MALRIQQIACGEQHSIALLSDGSVYSTGRNANGQLGDGKELDKLEWVSAMPSGSDVIEVIASGFHSLVLKSNGSVWATGFNGYGQLGDGTTVDKPTWASVIPSGVTQVAAGDGHSLALKADGSVWATGLNNYGQLGDGTYQNQSNWTSVMPSGVTQVAVGGYHSLALKSDGSVWATGLNNYGQLGDGTLTNKTTWIPVIFAGVNQVVAGDYHSLVLKADGSVWATGSNYYGQLGDDTNNDKINWASVMPSGRDVIELIASGCHSLVLKSNGSVWATGNNYYGQLGDGTKKQRNGWKSVMASGVTQVAVGHYHSLALKSDGTLWKTGSNKAGQLGFEGPDSRVWIPDRFFERLLLESLVRQPDESPDAMTDPADDWRGLSL